MSAEPTWDDVEEGLAQALGALPEGAVLQLVEAELPAEGGYYAQLWQDAGKLHAEVSANGVVRPDRRLPAEAEAQVASLGWDRPGTGNPVNWSTALEWPAPAAGYRRLAGRVVAVLRDVFHLVTPAELTYRYWLAGTGEELPLPGLGLDPLDIAYYARLAPGDEPDRPKAVLRRIRVGYRITDEELRRDGGWIPTTTLNEAERGELGDELVRIDHAQAARLVDGWRRPAEAPAAPDATGSPLRWTALPRDAAGRPTGTGRPPLDGAERSSVAGYLRSAPVVVAALGFDEDLLDPGRPEVVPLAIRTDGEWVWPESDGYYADRYGLAPEPEFVAHVRRRGYRAPEVDDGTLRRAARLVSEQATG